MPRCAVCAAEHPTQTCPLLIAKKEANRDKVDIEMVKCCNCGANHTSTFPNCPIRLQHLAETNIYHHHSNKRTKPAFNLATEKFPELAPRPTNSPLTPAPRTPYTTNNTHRWRPTPAPQFPSTNTHNNLYTGTECLQLLDEFYRNLQGCKSKQEQAKAIADFGIKYLCQFP